MKRRVTIKDVAAEAGVSVQTVSRVMNKGPNVTAAMQAKVTAAVEKLGYTPSIAAQRLGGSRSFLILALNDRGPTIEGWQARRGNDWVDQMLFGAMLKCAEYGYRMLFELVDSHSPQLLQQVQAAVGALHPDGVILTPPHSENAAICDLLDHSGVRYARLGSKLPGNGYPVFMDDEAAARVATEHLLGLGHVRVGFVEGHPEYAASADRLRGFRTTLLARGVAVIPGYVQPGDFTYQAGVAAMEAYARLAEPPTGIVAGSDEMALGVLHAATRMGFRVPRDLSLVSFDDTPTVRMSVPPLTAIQQPIAAMAACASQLLIEAKAGRGEESGAHCIPFAFIPRESTTAPPR